MESDPSFRITDPGPGALGMLWGVLADVGFLGWFGRLWFASLSDTASARRQFRQAAEDHEALKPTHPYAQALQAIQNDPEFRLVEQDPALGEQVLIHAACFDRTWIQLRGHALAHAHYLRLYCVSRFKPFRQAYTFDLVQNEITRHRLPSSQWHREVPYVLWTAR